MKQSPENIQFIFLIGAARSGTKFLRDMLASAPECSATAYDMNFLWRRHNETATDDVLPPDSITPALAETFKKRLIAAARYDANKGHHILLEKTVSNGLRIPHINAAFPNAKFIHLIRDGRDVTESAMRMWQNDKPSASYLIKKALASLSWADAPYMFWYGKNYLTGLGKGRKGGHIWGPRYPNWQDDIDTKKPLPLICARQWQLTVGHAETGLNTLSPDRVMKIRYEDLMTSPQYFENLCDFIGIKDKKTTLENFEKNRRPNSHSLYEKNISDKDKDIIMAEISSRLAELNYT